MKRWFAFTAIALSASGCVPQLDRTEDQVRAPRAQPGVKPGGSVRVGVAGLDVIDPARAHQPVAKMVVRTMCDQLVGIDPVTSQPVPSIAASWSISNGGRRLFIRLRENVVFSNGRKLHAEDVAYALSRLASERLASPAARLVEDISGFEFVHGDAQTRVERARVRLLGVTVVDPRSLEIGLDEPDSDFIRVLADPATTPVGREEAERDPAGFARAPVCAGPYRAREPWNPGQELHLVRSPSHLPVATSLTRSGAGYADELAFVSFSDRAAAVKAFATASLDVALAPESVGATAGAEIVRGTAAQTEMIGFPTTIRPFDDVRVRVALSRAIDRAAVAERVYGDARTPASSMLSPALGPDAPDTCGADAPPAGDVDGARRLLREAGVDLSSVSIPFYVNEDGRNRAFAEEILRQWQQGLGFAPRIVPVPWERFLDLGTRAQGFDGVFRFSWAPDVPAASRVFAPLLLPSGIGKNNFSLFEDPDLTEALRAGAKAVDASDRRREAQRAARIVCDAMPLAPVVYASRASLVRTSRVVAATGRWLDVWEAFPVVREIAVR